MLRKRSVRRMSNEINAGSMADIAFLLLIFFLVTTQIKDDRGIAIQLAPYSDVPPPSVVIDKENLYQISIDSLNAMTVNNTKMDVASLRANLKSFIQSKQSSAKNGKLFVSLNKSPKSTFEMYASVYSEVKAAYRELWDVIAQAQYKKYYGELDKDQKANVSAQLPFTYTEQ